MKQAEKIELARAVNATGVVLRRYFYQHVFSGGDDEALPALTPPQVEMIMAIHSNGSMTVKQLARVLCVKAPSVSARVERLVELGMLTREENPADRREVLIRISPKHAEFIQELDRRKLRAGIELVERMGPRHARMWREVCQRIEEVLGGAPDAEAKNCCGPE